MIFITITGGRPIRSCQRVDDAIKVLVDMTAIKVPVFTKFVNNVPDL